MKASKETTTHFVTMLFTFLASAQGVQTHVHTGEAVRFFSGLRHPISGFDHAIPMIAVGLWSAQLGAPDIWVVPVAFAMVMAFEGMLGLLGVPLPGMEFGIAASAILLGATVMVEFRPPIALAAALVGSFAIFDENAHRSELLPGESGLLYSIGFVMSTGCLHAARISIGLVHHRNWGQRALRVAGAAIVPAGMLFMGKVFA